MKLLRVLESFKFEPVGSNQTREVDVRVILATNQDLGELVKAGQFREDLYYRVNVMNIFLPPLRERPQDIIPLAQHFLDKYRDEAIHAVQGIIGRGHARPDRVRLARQRARAGERGAAGRGALPQHLREP